MIVGGKLGERIIFNTLGHIITFSDSGENLGKRIFNTLGHIITFSDSGGNLGKRILSDTW